MKMSEDKYLSIFAKSNGGYCVYYPSNIFHNMRKIENWGIFNNYSLKWRGLVEDIYQAAKRQGQYPLHLSWMQTGTPFFPELLGGK